MNKLDLIEISEDACLGWIFQYPKLVEVSFSMSNPKFDKNLSKYLAIVKNDAIIGVCKYEYFSQFAIQLHPYVNPEYWGTSLVKDFSHTLVEFFKEHGAKSLIAMCPEDARHAIFASLQNGFKKIAVIEQAVNWKGRLNNLIMLQRIL